MQRYLVFAWMVGLALTSVMSAEETVGKEFEKLHGAWKVVSGEKDGQPLERIKDGKLLIKDQNFVITTASGSELKGDLRLDVSKKPRTIDLAHQEGVLRDKIWLAIYELDGDDLKICYAEADSNKERPTEFSTAQDSGMLLVVLRRDN